LGREHGIPTIPRRESSARVQSRQEETMAKGKNAQKKETKKPKKSAVKSVPESSPSTKKK